MLSLLAVGALAVLGTGAIHAQSFEMSGDWIGAPFWDGEAAVSDAWPPSGDDNPLVVRTS